MTIRIKSFPLSPDFPSREAQLCAQRVHDLAHETAKTNRGDKYKEHRVIWHNLEELQFLYELAAGEYNPPNAEGYVLQCGIFCGGSACVLAKAVKDSKQTYKPVIAIDVYKHGSTKPELLQETGFAYQEARVTQHAHDLTNYLYLVIGNDLEFIKNFWKPQIRLAFIDSSHSYNHTVQEIAIIIPYVAANGIVLFHDYFNPTTGVEKAVNEFFTNYNARTFTAYNFRNRILAIKFDEGEVTAQDNAQNLRRTTTKKRANYYALPRQRNTSKLPFKNRGLMSKSV